MSKQYIVLPVVGKPYILSDVIRDEKNNIDNHQTVKKVVNGYWEHISVPIRIHPMFSNESSEWEKVDEFLNDWKPTSEVLETRIYWNGNGSHTQTLNPAIYMEIEQKKYPINGNICIVVTDGDFNKYDFSSYLNTYEFDKNPDYDDDESENDEN